MNVKGINVNFDRIMRVTFWYGATAGGAETVISEFAPLDNEAYCADMKVTVTDIINPTIKNGLPGFTAQITITNPHPSILRILANHVTWMLDYTKAADPTRKLIGTPTEKAAQSNQNLLDYYSSRVKVRVEAGYWNDGKRDYNLIFEGYVNSNSWYRKGTDNILVLAAYNIDITQLSANAIKDVGVLGTNVKENVLAYAQESLKEREKRSGQNTAGWMAMARKLVLGFSVDRPNPAYAPGSTVGPNAPYIQVTNADRNNPNWYKIKPIYTPRRKSEENLPLWHKLQALKVDRFYTTAGNLDTMISELANFNGADVNFEIDDRWEQGIRTLFVWPRGAEIKPTKGEDAEIQIINYQNILEAPAITADGSLNVKMFFNAACRPGLALSLMLTEKQGSLSGQSGDSAVIQAGRGLNDTLSFSGAPNPYYPATQGAQSLSLYSQELEAVNQERLKQDSVTRGYMFNTGFPMREITHTLATRGNDWMTTVKTIPMNVGLMPVKNLKE